MKDCIYCGAAVYHFGGESICNICIAASGRKCIGCGERFLEKGIKRRDLYPVPDRTVQGLLGTQVVGETYICSRCKGEIEKMEY